MQHGGTSRNFERCCQRCVIWNGRVGSPGLIANDVSEREREARVPAV